ncbi:MAG: polysaccharide deacetylase family protein [Verrucomicrobiae bacterium]|nr:polysaccharide deacetylase family protein [Verrucomicrobiae bacterium]
MSRWLVLVMISLLPAAVGAEPSLAERLGYAATDRLLIVNGDDVGMCHAANVATVDALENGLMRSATILVPCPWFPEIADHARTHPEKDFGIHLCQTSEWRRYRWGPLSPKSEVPGLVDPDGYFWHETPQVYAKSNPGEALIESRAQIRKALAAGVDVTHLDSHMGVLQYRPDYLESYLQLAVEFDLPVRMASEEAFARAGHSGWRERFAARGILFPDDLIFDIHYTNPGEVKGFWMERLADLKPGVTELFIHAALPTDELQAITGTWAVRAAEHELFTRDADLRALLEAQGVKLIGFRPIRELQRRLRKSGP